MPAYARGCRCSSGSKAAAAENSRGWFWISGGLSTAGPEIAREVLKGMTIHKLELVALALLTLGAFPAGAGLQGRALASERDEPKGIAIEGAPRLAVQKPESPTPAKKNAKAAGPGRMFVTGRVLDPKGKPVANANVMAYARKKLGDASSLAALVVNPAFFQGRADADGRFHIDAPRSSSSEYDVLAVSALAPGYGIGFTMLDPDAPEPSADISLGKEVLVEGRFTDILGKPANGVDVVVGTINQTVQGRVETMMQAPWSPRKDLGAWPGVATTDADGRFRIRGLGRDLMASLTIEDTRFARQNIVIQTSGSRKITSDAIKVGADPKALAMAVAPAQTITGRVLYADPGQSVPNATIWVQASRGNRGGGTSVFRADSQGRFRMNPRTGDKFSLTVEAADDRSYLSTYQTFDWPNGAITHSIDVKLVRGVMIDGKVVEEGVAKTPVEGAIARFVPYDETKANPNYLTIASLTQADGSFRLAAPTGPGALVIQGPSDDFVLRAAGTSGGMLYGRPGISPSYAHAYQFLDINANSKIAPVTIALRRATTVKGLVVGPDGQPARNAKFMSRLFTERAAAGGWKRFSQITQPTREGHFELHGVDPEEQVPVFFIDPERSLGATVNVSGRSVANGPITVRLEPCGSATMRLVDSAGKVLANRGALVTIVQSVAPRMNARGPDGKVEQLSMEGVLLTTADPVHYQKPVPSSDARGHVSLPALIPGATYQVIDRTVVRTVPNPVRKEFSVKAGETVDLGDILIGKPEAFKP
jgi:protocatechuate 3,4-dioxygenase beta subunit